ncbi:MAG: porin family protein [Candidatus Margulisbacteria bacterium]|nr:porin family protein [Candidatus Margulisiibacteriota bacterium]MBU1021799.1 porin family protein [Candidatus Margulisiibacteriota bacterium]MBU1729264.1 porin family protein [Candidatus Margulisiibacteriota bacterium]MBU1955537.1 porin family protein [Candidatus Margulisiibacteriota bacterium]
MKKFVIFLVICLFVVASSSVCLAKANTLSVGGVFGSFNGEGISTTYGGPVVHYGIMDELDIAGRYEAGSYWGTTLSFLTIGLNYNFYKVTGAVSPYVTAGFAQVYANFPGGFESTSGFFYGVGLNWRLVDQFLLNFDFRSHQATYAGFTLNATAISVGLMADIL